MEAYLWPTFNKKYLDSVSLCLGASLHSSCFSIPIWMFPLRVLWHHRALLMVWSFPVWSLVTHLSSVGRSHIFGHIKGPEFFWSLWLQNIWVALMYALGQSSYTNVIPGVSSYLFVEVTRPYSTSRRVLISSTFKKAVIWEHYQASPLRTLVIPKYSKANITFSARLQSCRAIGPDAFSKPGHITGM